MELAKPQRYGLLKGNILSYKIKEIYRMKKLKIALILIQDI